MELRLKNGDYLADGLGALVRAEGDEALLERVLFRLCARRGGFAPLPELGSRLHLLGRERPGLRQTAAQQYVAEALAQEDVEVSQVTLTQGVGGAAELMVQLRTKTAQWQLTVQVEGV